MAALATNVVPNTGLRVDNLTGTTPNVGGDDCATGQGVFLLVKNTSGGALTVTLATPQVVDGDLTVSDRTFTVAATTGQSVIPVPDLYRSPSTGRAAITYPGGVTGLTVAVVRVP
jgi:hypothetical protein